MVEFTVNVIMINTENHYTLYNVFGLRLIAHPPEHPQYGRDQNESAHPPYGGCSRVPGAPEGEQTYFLVGNN